MTNALLRAAAAAVALAPMLAAAQRPATPVVLSRAALTPGTWTYTMRMVANGQSQEIGTRTITVAPSTYGGAAAWLITEGQKTPAVAATDSLFVGRADLESLHRVQWLAGPQGSGSMTMRFTADSVMAEVSGGGQKQQVSIPRKAGAAATGTVVELAMRSLPLAMGWHGTVNLLVPQSPGFTALDMTVVGEEKVTVPAGTFDTWVLSVKTAAGEQKHYVAKGGNVVRSVMAPPQLNGGTIESVLQAGPAAR